MSSTIIAKNIQVGTSGTATNNFTWYQPAAPDGTVRLGVGNYGATTLDAVTVTSAGNFGLGVTPSAWGTSNSVKAFQTPAGAVWNFGTTSLYFSQGFFFNGSNRIYSATGSGVAEYSQQADAHVWASAGSGTAGNTVSLTERMRINSSGNVGIGTTSPQAKLHAVSTVTITDDSTYPIIAGDATTNGKRLLLGYTGASNGYGVIQAVSSGVAWTDLAVQPNGGNLLVGTTSSIAKLTLNGVGGSNQQTLFGGGWGSGIGAFASLTAANTSNADVIYFNTSAANVGKIAITSTATSYVTSSDYRLKENVQPMTGALAKVALLKPCTYTWKADGTLGQGFIAHELAEVVPDAVTGEKDAVDADGNIKPQGIDTSFLVATLTAAIQEQQALIESLTARIAALEAK